MLIKKIFWNKFFINKFLLLLRKKWLIYKKLKNMKFGIKYDKYVFENKIYYT